MGRAAKLPPRYYEPFRKLFRAGVARKKEVLPNHEARGGHPGGNGFDWYFLDRSSGGEALVMGAFAAEIEDQLEATANWKLHQQPARAEHALFRNEYFLRVMEDLRAANDARRAKGLGSLGNLDLDELYGESHPYYPLFGQRSAAAKPPPGGWRGYRGHEWTVPDGRMLVRWPGVGACAYDVEVEYKSRKKLLEKIEKRAGWIRRLHEDRVARAVAAEVRKAGAGAEREGKDFRDRHAREAAEETRANLHWLGLPDEVCPVLFLYPTWRKAVGMRDRLREAASDGRLPRYAALGRELRPHADRRLGRLFLFAGWDEVARGSVDGVYAALDPYPPGAGGDGTGLRQVAMYTRGFVADADGGGGGR